MPQMTSREVEGYLDRPIPKLKASYCGRRCCVHSQIRMGWLAGTTFLDILRSGKPKSVLRVQVYLKNQGFNVAIDGKVSPKLEAALNDCLEKKGCIEAFGQPI